MNDFDLMDELGKWKEGDAASGPRVPPVAVAPSGLPDQGATPTIAPAHKAREIKFRAWVSDTRTMVSWEEINSDFQRAHDTTLIDYINAPECHVMQYTGLKDRNGKEIYEGDIVEGRLHGRCVVEYRSASFGIVGGQPHGFRNNESLGYYPFNLEVIGNIWENPELLEP